MSAIRDFCAKALGKMPAAHAPVLAPEGVVAADGEPQASALHTGAASAGPTPAIANDAAPERAPVKKEPPTSRGPGANNAGPDEELGAIIEGHKGVNVAKAKELTKRLLALVEKEMSKPANQQRIINAISGGKLSPSGGVDPYDELEAEETVTIYVWSAIVRKVLVDLWIEQQAIDSDTVFCVDEAMWKLLRARFHRMRSELEKTVPRDRFSRLKYERKKVDQEITRLQEKIRDGEKELEEKKKRLEQLSKTDARTPLEQNEPPHPPYSKMHALKVEIENLRVDIKVWRVIAEKDLPKKARELDAEIAKGR
jgi:hypothetical protein